jgi:glucose-6-phosphate isomerase
MLFEQEIDGCFADRVGEGGLTREAYSGAIERAGQALKALREAATQRTLPLLAVPAMRDDLVAAGSIAQRLRNGGTDIVIFGIGGSSLGAQALAQLKGYGTPAFAIRSDQPRIHFLESPDPETFRAVFAQLPLATTRFVVISKSGGTAETLAQMLAAMDAVYASRGASDLAQQFVAVCEPGDNALRRLAERHGLSLLDHPPDVGGRFSVLTVVGALPALLMGLDPAKLRAGAATVLDQALSARPARDVPAACGAALAVALAEQGKARACVLMPYLERLERFAMWYRQLWAESLGKNGKGTTPIRALGPVDQHSQLQLYLAGPKDKLFTLITAQLAGQGPRISARATDGDRDLAYLKGRTLGDLVAAEQRATAEALLRNGRPTRIIRIARLDEQVLGALFMHFMLETIFAAHLMNVNPFDQPAVEQGKMLARQYLREAET